MSLAPNTKKYEYPVRETTLWEDILVDHNILKPDEQLVEQQKALETARQRSEKAAPSAEQRLKATKGDTDKLAELEDELNDDDDERLLEKFRQARIQELKQKALSARFGSVERLGRDDFIPEVKEASRTGGLGGKPMYVVIELFREGLERSMLTSKAFDTLAKKHPDIKFVRMISDQCIQGWPDSRVPTIIVYHNGEALHQLIGIQECGNGKLGSLWKALSSRSAIPPPEDDDDVDNDDSRGRKDDQWE